jgi:hypothetical protein
VTVTVYLDGLPVVVPEQVDSHYAARGALGIQRGEAVGLQARAGDDDTDRLLRRSDPLEFEGGWLFEEGDRYVRLDIREVLGKTLEDQLREPWEKDPEAWKDDGVPDVPW